MKRVCSSAAMILFLFSVSYSIGFQHGVFRSQSTQGAPWQGTATITKEHYDITVYPDYLDVEMEWVFEVGGNKPDSFTNALEIVGNINLVEKSTVVGMLTWHKGKILKGKLKTDSVAREQYENVVDRSSVRPMPPRDPVLLEYGWGIDNYDISIFPVEFNGTKKVRIRYVIPAFSINGTNKILYPYAFTQNATVDIKKGSGTQGYIIETDLSKKQFSNSEPVVLGNEYSLQAYGGTAGQRITYVVPVLSNMGNGSTIYSGSFSTPSFSGQMYHVTTMSGKQALRYASISEDYVILWRWNHPKILIKYARQIVEQSLMLKEFLSTLESKGKRAALVISKEGGENITFHLDKKGGAEFKRMIKYLDSLGKQAVLDPPMSPTNKNIINNYDIAQGMKEFENAIKAAMELFDKESVTLKHILILTAGPQLVFTSSNIPAITIPAGTDISMFYNYIDDRNAGQSVFVNQYYWPGINLVNVVNRYDAGLSVYATVSNGKDSSRILASAPSPQTCNSCTGPVTEMHLYSKSPLLAKIKWSIYNKDSLLLSYNESPGFLNLEDGMQYARLIGSSRHLVPLADKMPSSLASTLGFIDKKYSLVALEEDSLPGSVASRYEQSGVPVLDPSEIYASADERSDMPVGEWLKANPPVPMVQNIYPFSIVRVLPGAIVILDVALPSDKKAASDVAAGFAPPQASSIYTLSSSFPDYTEALSVRDEKQKTFSRPGTIPFIYKNGTIVIELSKFGISGNEAVQIALYDCAGRIVGKWNSSVSKNCLTINMNTFAHGTYMLRVSSRSTGSLQKLVVR
jgi:hypothetical protein